MIQHLSAITFAVRDMAQALAFYNTLGFETIAGGADATFSSLRMADAFVNLVLKPDYVPTWWGRMIFRVKDVDALYASITARGLQPSMSPRDAAWGERYFHLTDPNGHELSFAALLPPSNVSNAI
jgi:catechol 2,3-dioxygenase-like lactoylglutathione lyase family enzyme